MRPRAASTGGPPWTSRARKGGPALRALTFAERGALLQAMCDALQAHRDELLDLAVANGGNTRSDAKFDVDGAAFTLAAYAELGKSLGDAPLPGRRRGHHPRAHAALPRPARRGAAPRRRRPHQRVQLPRLGPGREGRGGAPGRHAGGQQARHQHRLAGPPHRGDPGREERAARGRALAARGRRRRPARAPGPPGRGGVHGLLRHGRQDPRRCPR